jgi:hypothetical protein
LEIQIRLCALSRGIEGFHKELEQVTERVAKWRQSVAQILEEGMLEGDVALFRNDVGLPDPPSPGWDVHEAREETRLYQEVRRRSIRIQEFMKSLERA